MTLPKPPPSLTTLAARLKGEPGLWSIHPVPIQAAPAGDATETHHGRGETPPIPSYKNRMLITIAVDAVRLYYAADDITDPTDHQSIITAAEFLYKNANLAAVPEQELVGHILGHWPLPPPSLWLLRIVNAIGMYNAAMVLPAPYGTPLMAAAKNALQAALDGVDGDGDGYGAPNGGGH